MSYSYKYNDRQCCRHNQQTMATGKSCENDTDSVYTYETIKHSNRTASQKSKHFPKDVILHDSNNDIGSQRTHNSKCPVYVHNMKMQKRYSQNDAYQNPKTRHHQAEVYNYNKWDFYDDRTHYMKNKFDNLTLDNDYEHKHHKSECTRKPCPVHHGCNTINKSSKKRSSPIKTDSRPADEEVINRLEESYWTKWKPKCNAHDRKMDAGEAKMIRTEEDYNRRKTCCESERYLPSRCPDCFKYIPDDNDVKCLHKRTATKESKSSDFVKSEFEDVESQLEDNEHTDITEPSTNGCDCPKSCPGKVEMSSSEYSEKESPAPYDEKQCDENAIDVKEEAFLTQDPKETAQKEKNTEKTAIDSKAAQECHVPTCPYVVATKLKKSEAENTNSCHNPNCPYVRATQYKTAIALEGQDDEEQLNITQYSAKTLPNATANKGENAESTIPNTKKTVQDKIINKTTKETNKEAANTDTNKDAKNVLKTKTEKVTDPIKPIANDPMVTGDSKKPNTAKTTDQNAGVPQTGPEGAEIPVQLKHTDSFILNSIKQTSSEGKPHYKQPTTIKLSNTPRVKGHSYPLKPILKKEKPHTPRKTLHSPKKPINTNMKTLKPTHKKR